MFNNSKKNFIILILILSISIIANAAYLRNVPITITQPDGKEIKCFATGDEYYHWIHDEENYTIIEDQNTGYFVYAQRENDKLVPSRFIVGESQNYKNFLKPGINISPEKLMEKRKAWECSGADPKNIVKAKSTGQLNNIVVFIRFSGESEFTQQLSFYNNMFNNSNAGANSMYNYFKEASYNQLTISTTFYPSNATSIVSYQDSHVRNYYRPYSVSNTIGYQTDDERRIREHTLLANAINFISNQVPQNLNLDYNNDGRVDNVCFIIRGSTDNWSDLLWPHMWSLYSSYVYLNGKRVYTYNFQIENHMNSSGVGVLCHEMFHSLGAPDLYHYNENGIQPVGDWDIMESTKNPPQHMGAYMKYMYGEWIDNIPTITSSGTYSLKSLMNSKTNCAYKILSPNSVKEYFIVEYRKREGTFENSLPSSGLLVYRINKNVEGDGNASGPPDEVYIYRKNGTLTSNGYITSATFSANSGRTSINDNTNPSSFLSNGSPGGLNIHSIGSIGDSITFTVVLGLTPPTLVSPVNNATNISYNPVLVWNTVSEAAYYNLQVATDIDFTSLIVNAENLTANSYNLSGLASFTTYYWRVSAKKIDNTLSGWSSIWKFTTELQTQSLPYMTDFSNCNGWSEITDQNAYRWSLSEYTNNAGGEMPEMTTNWTSLYSGTCRLISPRIDATGASYVRLKFKHFYYKYGNNVSLKIQSSSDKINWTDEQWGYENTTVSIGPEEVTTTINNNLGNSLYIAWVLNGSFENYWNLDDILIEKIVDINENNNSAKFSTKAYPNPFNPNVTLEYTLPEKNNVLIEIFNINGEKIITLEDTYKSAGNYKVTWNGKNYKGENVSSGIYFYKITSGNNSENHKLILIK